MLIYRLTFASGKSYVGQTTRTMEKRYAQHRAEAERGSPLPVHAAWRKYGAPSFEIVSHHSSYEALNAAEIAEIAASGCVSPDGYNLCGGGLGGKKHPETKAKISAANAGRTFGDCVRAKVSAASKRHWEDPVYRAKVSEGVSASFTAERRAAISEHAKRIHTGKVVSSETRRKLSERVVGPEQRARMSASAKARVREPVSDETRAKISAALKGHDGKARASAISEGKKKSFANMTPEQRQAFSEIRKRAWETRRKRAAEKEI